VGSGRGSAAAGVAANALDATSAAIGSAILFRTLNMRTPDSPALDIDKRRS